MSWKRDICFHSHYLSICYLGEAFVHQIRQFRRVFEHSFDPGWGRGGEEGFERANPQKLKCSERMLKLRTDRRINLENVTTQPKIRILSLLHEDRGMCLGFIFTQFAI